MLKLKETSMKSKIEINKETLTTEGKNEDVIIELNEMWHFLHSKKDTSGFGNRIAEQQNSLLTGNVEHEILKRLQNYIED